MFLQQNCGSHVNTRVPDRIVDRGSVIGWICGSQNTSQEKRGFGLQFFPTASHEKLTIASFVMPLSSDGLAVEHNHLHSFEILEHILLSIASFRFGLSIAASAAALKLHPLAGAFPRRCYPRGKSPHFLPDS